MKKWEYKTISFKGLPWKIDGERDAGWEVELNQQGQQGWELISVIHREGDFIEVVAFLKRQSGTD